MAIHSDDSEDGEPNPTRPDPRYVARVVLGLVLVAAGVVVAFVASKLEEDLPRWAIVAGLVLLSTASVPLVKAAVRRRDEFHRSLYEQACGTTVPVAFATFAIIGVLQASDLLPPLSAFASMAVVLVTWGVSLSFTDRHFRS